ncbi:MAG TPA: SDR family oxidoreductase [Solirubrobacteraceae bacterium]|jgi:NAD(P)-dependent dehydrogenase (short-subunit alcohol dehydrogenase family)|nr:SDR family oxidoreductase [Solirubrobacteraceae bacterium]
MRTAIVTGASRGLGLELALALAQRGWRLVVDAQGADELQRARAQLAAATDVVAIAGDVADPAHRARLAEAAEGHELELLVNNASTLGTSPLPALADYDLDVLGRVFAVNALAPLALAQLALARMPPGARIVNVTSDAAVEAYEGWGGYGASKAALEQLSAVLAAERPDLRVYAVDPGDMNTRMHQDAFPGEDVSDRPPPRDSVPGLLALVECDLPSGRYRAAELAAQVRA